MPLVEGRPISGVESVLLVADAQNGVCTALPAPGCLFVNADLGVRLFRPFEGEWEWVGLRARARGEARGIGMNPGTLFDAHGEVGSVEQSLALAKG